jgi:hypothetical protein
VTRKIRWVRRKSLIEMYYAKEVGREHTPNRAMLQKRIMAPSGWSGLLWHAPVDDYDAHYAKGTWKEVVTFPADAELPVMKKVLRCMLYLRMDTGI